MLNRVSDNLEELREKIIDICLPEWQRDWDEATCRCSKCLERAGRRTDQILALVRPLIAQARKEGFDEGLQKTMDAAEGTYGSQIDELKKQLKVARKEGAEEIK